MGRINWNRVFRYGRWIVPATIATVRAIPFAETYRQDPEASDRDKNISVVNNTINNYYNINNYCNINNYYNINYFYNINNYYDINTTCIHKTEITQNHLIQGGRQDSKTPQCQSAGIGPESPEE